MSLGNSYLPPQGCRPPVGAGTVFVLPDIPAVYRVSAVAREAYTLALDIERTWLEAHETVRQDLGGRGAPNWPSGSCVEASLGLRDEVCEKLPEAGAEFVWGTFLFMAGGFHSLRRSHAWVQLGTGDILDLTVRQFGKDWVEPLPLIPQESALALRFEIDERDPSWARCATRAGPK